MPKILIIEDEDILLNVLKNKLQKEGYEVIEAHDGEEGIKQTKKAKPDLVLLDIVMPKKDGFEVLEALRKGRFLPPIIIISNSGQPVEIEKALRLGAKDYLIKAEFDPQEVVDKVKNQLKELSEVGSQGKNAPQKDADAIEEEEIKTEESPIKNSDNGSFRILIIEDDKFLRDLIALKLGREGLDVVEAIDGEVGLRKISEEKPTLVLLDLILPGIDGFEVLEKMKKNPDTASIPVIILSNLGQKEDVERGLRLGATDYLIKAHFTPNEIIEKIKKLLTKA